MKYSEFAPRHIHATRVLLGYPFDDAGLDHPILFTAGDFSCLSALEDTLRMAADGAFMVVAIDVPRSMRADVSRNLIVMWPISIGTRAFLHCRLWTAACDGPVLIVAEAHGCHFRMSTNMALEVVEGLPAKSLKTGFQRADRRLADLVHANEADLRGVINMADPTRTPIVR